MECSKARSRAVGPRTACIGTFPSLAVLVWVHPGGPCCMAPTDPAESLRPLPWIPQSCQSHAFHSFLAFLAISPRLSPEHFSLLRVPAFAYFTQDTAICPISGPHGHGNYRILTPWTLVIFSTFPLGIHPMIYVSEGSLLCQLSLSPYRPVTTDPTGTPNIHLCLDDLPSVRV